ncbi:inorganic phosphate transporter, partial [Bacillus cereus]|uniref:inorganic phosphate transporter n=1 Tax=Bacillus cereus TaxID=1396 RepID=UPI0020BE6194
VNGAAADLASATVIFGATLVHLPVSTTHVISSSKMGVGSAQRVRGVNWGMARKIVTTWIITMPISVVMASV